MMIEVIDFFTAFWEIFKFSSTIKDAVNMKDPNDMNRSECDS